MEVYVDIIFLINFFMDFFIFWITKKFIMKNVSIKRLLFGAFFSSATYCVITFVDFLNFLYNPLWILIILIFSVFITFGAANIKELLKNTIFFIVTSFAAGGLATALFYFCNISNFIGNFIDIYIHNFSLKFLIFSISFFYILLKFVIVQYKKITIKRRVFCGAEIFLKDKRTTLKALIDTGNSLYEPISGKPVIIAELSALKKVIPDGMNNFFEKNGNSVPDKIYDCIKFGDFDIELRIIPFSSIGKRKGAIMGFLADKAVIHYEKEFCFEKAVIGICDFKLSATDDYNALLNPQMFKDTDLY